MDNDEHTQTAQDRREDGVYEAPSLRVLGTFAALTEGVPGNAPPDGVHSGGMS